MQTTLRSVCATQLGYMLNWLKKWCHNKNKDYNEIEYSMLGTLEENSKKLLESTVVGHGYMQQRDEQDYKNIGMLFSVLLLIEYKLVDLLSRFDEKIEDRTFGHKIDVFKDFLKTFEAESDDKIQEYRNIIAPLKRIKSIRNEMAHNLKKTAITNDEIKEIAGYVKSVRPDLAESISDDMDDDVKNIRFIILFGFVFAEKIAGLRCAIK